MFNGKRRPLYSIRHMNALKLYEDLKNVDLVAQALNTSPEIVKSNYLNYSDEWARNRFKVLGYDKRKLPQSSMKSKNKVSDKWWNSQWSSQWSLSKKVYIMLLIKIEGETERPLIIKTLYFPITFLEKPQWSFNEVRKQKLDAGEV